MHEIWETLQRDGIEMSYGTATDEPGMPRLLLRRLTLQPGWQIMPGWQFTLAIPIATLQDPR